MWRLQVLKMLLNVQRQWASLEAIFMGSQDIRSQLPDDSKRFEVGSIAAEERLGSAYNSWLSSRG
jgi:hypothetical protein